MNNQDKNTSGEKSKSQAQEKVGSSMARLLNSTEAKLVSGSRSGPSPRGPGH